MVVRTPVAGMGMLSLVCGILCVAIPGGRAPRAVDDATLHRAEIADHALHELDRIDRALHELDVRIEQALRQPEGCRLGTDVERRRAVEALARLQLARARAEAAWIHCRNSRLHIR